VEAAVSGRASLAALGLLLGCGSTPLPAPTIDGIQPSTMVASQPTPVAVQVDAQLPFTVDFGQGTIAVDARMQVTIGPQELGSGSYPPDGLVQGTLATLLPTGTYNVSVLLGDGRSAVRQAAFTVTPGTWPAGYSFEPIPPQRSGVPFTITLHAVPPNAATFGGNVGLDVTGGASLAPSVSGAFSAGGRVERVTVTGSGQLVLVASDIVGNSGQSAPFNVAP
jgi:hypothetical protein